MEDLTIFRLFLAFPLIGLLIPDAGSIFSSTGIHVPLTHIIVEITLLTCIGVCTAGLTYAKRKLGNSDDKALLSA